jgi:hypothetical protein
VLFDAAREPETPPAPGPEWLPRPEPSGAKLLAEALLERATSPAEIVRGVRAALRGPRQVAGEAGRALSNASKAIGAGMAAPPSPLNVEIGPHRRIVWRQCDLADFKAIKDGLGGTVNDAFLAVVAGGLGKWLRTRGVRTEGLELRGLVPVSIRAKDEHHGSSARRCRASRSPSRRSAPRCSPGWRTSRRRRCSPRRRG